MSDPIPLEYSDGRRTHNHGSVLALAMGLISGPITIAFVLQSGIAYGISIVGSVIALAVGFVSAIFCTWAYLKASRDRRRWGRILALIGLFATVGWTMVLIADFVYVDAHLE